jgi:hypothetical protein
MARMTASHKTQIIIALITVMGGIIVALLTSWDKFFPPAPGPAPVENRTAAPQPAPAPLPGETPTEAAARLKQAQEDVLNRSASTLEDISRQIDAQSANLSH